MRQLRWIALAVICHPFGEVRADTPEALRGNVLVWHDANWFAEPSDAAKPIALADLDGARKERVGHAFAMRVVSTAGAFVELEPIDAPGCSWSRLVVPDDIAKLKLFVKRDDLAPVLAKPFNKTYADGTKVALKPGMPVVATDGGFVVALRGDELVADIPTGSVAHSYIPERATTTVISGSVLAIAPRTKASVGERSFALTAWEAALVQRRGAAALVALEDRCATIHALVPAAAIKDSDDDPASLDMVGGSSGGVVGLRDEHYIPRLTPLSIGARQVAYVAKPIYLLAAPIGKTTCIERRLTIESSIGTLEPKHTDNKLRMCVPTSKVVHERMRSARSANGTTTR